MYFDVVADAYKLSPPGRRDNMPHASVHIPGAAARLQQLRHATDRLTDRRTGRGIA